MNTEIKGTLAKLLATENLLVEHKNVETAAFDVANRVLTLPMWEASNTVYNMLVGHEVGHALYTPEEGLEDLPCPKAFINVTEDVRIEKLMKRKFPGLGKDFYQGYQQLNDRDFFSIENRNLWKLSLIDRINLHYKIGAYAVMPFTDAEVPLRDAVEGTETFQDAIDAAIDIFRFMKEEIEKQKEQVKAQGTEEIPGSSGDQGEGEEETEDDNDTDEYDKDPDGGVYDEPPRPEEEIADDFQDEMDYLSPEEQLKTVETQECFNGNMENLKARGAREVTYVNLPAVPLDTIVVDNKIIWDKAEQWWNDNEEDFNEIDLKFNEFCKRTKKDVNYLVKEFECRKAASTYARTSSSKTGVIDTSKLHNYKIAEDIFKRVTKTTDGKNHGLIFLLDWSGSMSREISDTVYQLINLCQFCKKVDIPFDVYTFTSDGGYYCQSHEEPWDYPELDHKQGELWIEDRFRLCNLLTSKGNKRDFQRQCRNLYRIAYYYEGYYYGIYGEVKAVPRPPHFLGLGGTPLNEGLVCVNELIPQWKAAHNVEKTHLVILTDGEANCMGYGHERTNYVDRVYQNAIGWGTCIRDKKTGRYYTDIKNGNVSLTQTLIRIIRDHNPGTSVLGFRICQPRNLSMFLRMNDIWSTEKYKREWSKNKSVVITDTPYNQLYVIQSNDSTEEVSMEVKEDATKGQIRTAFKKALKKKVNNRRILATFAGQIA